MLFTSNSENNEHYRDSGNVHYLRNNHIGDKEINVSQMQNHKLITVAILAELFSHFIGFSPRHVTFQK